MPVTLVLEAAGICLEFDEMGMSKGSDVAVPNQTNKPRSLIALNHGEIPLWLASLSLCVIWGRQDNPIYLP